MSVYNALKSQNNFINFELLSESTYCLQSVYVFSVTYLVTAKEFCYLKKTEAIAKGSLMRCNIEGSSKLQRLKSEVRGLAELIHN